MKKQTGFATHKALRLKTTSCSVAVLMGLALAAQVYAEEPADTDIQEVMVTGSRLTSSGFTQPTPTTSMTQADIERSAEPNVFNTIAKLPALQGSTGRATNTNSTSSGIQGLSSFSLRGLGTNRTLTLLDGQRVVAANVSGVTDVSQFPQLLLKRVDVVTGGASASYGSDAIGGVVNFITDKKFEGFKMNIEGGQTMYDDDKNGTIAAAWGSSFLDGKLHVALSGEYGKEDGIEPGGDNGFGEYDPSGRDYFKSAELISRPIAQTNDGKPQLYIKNHIQNFQYSKYGLITEGPLKGTAFGDNGQPYPFEYGTNCVSPFCEGGDLSANIWNGASLAGKLERENFYGRVGYDIDDENEIYMTATVARTEASNTPNSGAPKNGNLTIQCDNPFLPTSIKDACAANNITSFKYGTANAIFPNISVHPTRDLERFVIGAEGKFDLFGTSWNYDTYAEHGTTSTDLYVKDISLTARYNAAIDAVKDVNGNIVCRNATARASGCVPLNIIGNITPSAEALAYVLPENGPEQHVRQLENAFSFSVSGEPFTLPAGPVAVATGFEYRKEWYETKTDPYGNGGPTNEDYPADPLLNTNPGNNWYAGNFHSGTGEYDVKEAFLELNLPLVNSDALGRANLNLAGRETKYSTAGSVEAWKVGASWDTPLDGFRVRAVTSQDVRAPNLGEIYAPTQVFNATLLYNGVLNQVQQQTTGNVNLRPEIGRSSEFGIVLDQPEWAPGLSLSMDYFQIKVNDVISTLIPQQVIDLCEAGNKELCSSFSITGAGATVDFLKLQPFNLASMEVKGIDYEARQKFDLKGGTLTLRALATRTISYVTDSGVLGTIPKNTAGVNLGTTPYWKVVSSIGWDADKYSLELTNRWISDGVYSREYIECSTNCPTSTINNPTILDNHMDGISYFDLGGSYRFTDKVSAYFKVENLLNTNAPAAPGTPHSVNAYLYDIYGRMYRVGMRMSF
ncbi:MAG: TonB-dependent receptor [Gammaproteobacteria bacterium]|nr:MAG: TonB-dependent receptor [Gammaproteobacteria bacterium]